MKTHIYTKLVWYFSGLILITCLASATLFFVTVGRPMAKEGNQLIRNHVLFIAAQVSQLLARGEGRHAMDDFTASISDSYGMTVVVLEPGAGDTSAWRDRHGITGEMIREMEEKGIFVQSGHLSGTTVYLLPLEGKEGYTLYITREVAGTYANVWFFSGLAGMCLLLIAGIYPLARSLTRPIQRLSAAAEQMASGNFEPVKNPGQRTDELGRLEDTFREMAGSVREMMTSKKQLLADISHELRSPLGRMAVSLEMLSDFCGEDEISSRHIRLLWL